MVMKVFAFFFFGGGLGQGWMSTTLRDNNGSVDWLASGLSWGYGGLGTTRARGGGCPLKTILRGQECKSRVLSVWSLFPHLTPPLNKQHLPTPLCKHQREPAGHEGGHDASSLPFDFERTCTQSAEIRNIQKLHVVFVWFLWQWEL